MNKDAPNYKVELDTYSGPLDLLLYLIRRDEVDIYDIPIAHITEQYMQYMGLVSDLDINVAGEFLVMAATLMEIKSRMMAPQPEDMPEDEQEDPRLELVRQLMEYKRFKEAAVALGERAELRRDRFTRSGERPERDPDSEPKSAGDLALWMLLDAFQRILDQTGRRVPHMISGLGVPQEKIQEDLEMKVRTAGRMSFSQAFNSNADRLHMAGTFLAILELVKQQVLRVEQNQAFDEIWLTYVPEDERQVFDEPAGASESAAPDQDPQDEEANDDWAEDDADEHEPEDDDLEDDDPDDDWRDDDLDIELPEVPELDDDDSVPMPHSTSEEEKDVPL